MKQLKEVAQEGVLGNGSVALPLALGVIALAFFPIPVVVYIFYVALLSYVVDQARRWLRPLLTTWPRLLVCTVLSVGCIAKAWQLTPTGSLLAELQAVTFSFWTLLLTGVWLFLPCVGAARELWKSRSQEGS